MRPASEEKIFDELKEMLDSHNADIDKLIELFCILGNITHTILKSLQGKQQENVSQSSLMLCFAEKVNDILENIMDKYPDFDMAPFDLQHMVVYDVQNFVQWNTNMLKSVNQMLLKMKFRHHAYETCLACLDKIN